MALARAEAEMKVLYRHRQDVNSIIHTHPPHCSALSMVGEELAIAHMDTSMFYEDVAFLPEWPGVPIGDEEGEIITRAIGSKRAILLAHHGQLVACSKLKRRAPTTRRHGTTTKCRPPTWFRCSTILI